MWRCRVWAANRATPAPQAAVVACPARREWAVIRSVGNPAACARDSSIPAMALPEIGSSLTLAPRRLVKRTAAVPLRAAIQASRAATGSVFACWPWANADDLAPCLRVGLRTTDGQQQASGLGLDVGQTQRGELGATQR